MDCIVSSLSACSSSIIQTTGVFLCGCLLCTMTVVLLRYILVKKEKPLGNGILVGRIMSISKPLAVSQNPYLAKMDKEDEESTEVASGIYIPVSGAQSNELAELYLVCNKPSMLTRYLILVNSSFAAFYSIL